MSGYGLDSTGEVKSLRAAEAVDRKPVDVISTFFGGGVVPDHTSAQTYARSVLVPLTMETARRKLARFAAVRCGPLAFDVDAAREYLLAAREHGLERAVYSHQFASDDSVRLAVEVDAVSATHLEHIDDGSVEKLAGSRTIGVLTPAATFHMGLTRFAPARRLIDQGGAVALASGFNPDQCPTYSMPFVIAMACRYLGMSAAEAISAATVNAAHALRCAEHTGSLESGKQADILILNARDYRELPLTPGVSLVHTMIKSGRVAYQEGKC